MLLFVASLCAACVTHVQFTPVDDDWEPRGGGASALLRSGHAEVEVGLTADRGPFPLTGELRNRSAEVLLITFQPERQVSGDVVVGQVVGAGTPQPFRAGGGFDLLPAGGEGPCVRRFVLRPDDPWPDSGIPRVGATVSFVVLVRSSTGETRIPLRFRVRTSYQNLPLGTEPQWDRLPRFMHPWYGRDPGPEESP